MALSQFVSQPHCRLMSKNLEMIKLPDSRMELDTMPPDDVEPEHSLDPR
jgi:hypothetical protein